MSKINAPKGTRDIYAPEISRWQYLEDQVREFFSRYLYSEIRTPVFEASELFSRGIGGETEVVQKEMYTFMDKGGRSLTLRPENTASVVRALIENNLFDAIFPLRFFYFGPMFRYDKPQKGRYRQFHQFGVEVLREQSPALDAEVIQSAYEFLNHLGIRDTRLEVNSVGCQQCRPPYLEALSKAAEKNRENLCQDCRRKITTNPLRIFDCKQESCRSVARTLPVITENLCEECATHFNELRTALNLLQVPYTVNEKLVRGLDYYTKTAFEITSGQLGAQNALLGGGRYNNLIRELGGPDMPGIGFAAGAERILLHLTECPVENEPLVFIAFQKPEFRGEATLLADELRKQGCRVYMDYSARNLKKQFRKSDRLNADYTLVLGEDEINNKTVSVKNMKTEGQISVEMAKLSEWVKEIK